MTDALVPSTAEYFDRLIFVTKIRSQNPIGIGGCIFAGYEVDAHGERRHANKLYVVIAKNFHLSGEVSAGERWQVIGHVTRHERKTFNGFGITEYTVESDAWLVKERETGDLIVKLVANSPKFKGIGQVKMQKLWDRYGDRLYSILDSGDVASLTEVLGREDAAAFVEAWADHISGAVVSFLSSHKLPLWLSRKVLDFHGSRVRAALDEDPYRLLSFSAPWQTVDKLAREGFGVRLDDPRRLRAAIEESLYRLVDNYGHTCVPSDLLKVQLASLLMVSGDTRESKRLINAALDDNSRNGAYLITEDGHYWPTGAYVMEAYVAEEIAAMVAAPDPIAPSLFMSSVDKAEIDRLIGEFESKERTRIGKIFRLNPAQCEAVHNCVNNRFSLITGGAGTGKTTVLRCLYFVLQHAGYGVCQMALSGRAARRMNDATGIDATTIAGYLARSEELKEKLGDFGYYIVDESSMLDISTTYQIFRTISHNKSMRMVMVGDPYQLPPIMAGLVFHVLVETKGIPIVHLTETKRQEEGSGIPVVANAVRHGTLPALHAEGVGVRFIPCSDHEILDKVLELYAENPGGTQILCATKRCNFSGTVVINTRCHERFTKDSRDLLVTCEVTGFEGELSPSGFREGESIMFTKNDYARKVNNGSIGVLAEIYDDRHMVTGADELAIARGNFEGVDVELFESDFRRDLRKLDFGYSATVHKAQGSQWPRVIMPVRRSRNLDRTLIYTAITRAETEVILVGDEEALRSAVEREPKAHSRSVGFSRILPIKLAEVLAAQRGR